MRKKLIILTASVILAACNNSEKTKPTNHTAVVEHLPDISERQLLIGELKKLRHTITSQDKEKIADVFDFPLYDKSYSIYIDDILFNDQFKSNGNRITRSMFLQHYEAISKSIWIDQLKNLFHHIDLDSLSHKDTLAYEAYIKTEPCFYSYRIELNKRSVVLRMDMNSNRNYQSETFSEDDILENSSDICEHTFWWVFKFNGNKLQLKSISGAG